MYNGDAVDETEHKTRVKKSPASCRHGAAHNIVQRSHWCILHPRHRPRGKYDILEHLRNETVLSFRRDAGTMIQSA